MACTPVTALQQPAQSGWTVGKICLHRNESDLWIVYGELTNDTNVNYTDVEVEVELFSAAGSPLAQSANYVPAFTMPDGATFPFFVDFYDPIESQEMPASLVFSVFPGGTSDDTVRTDLQLRNLQLNLEEGSFTGEVRNPGTELSDSAEIIAAFYDEGFVIAVGYGVAFYDEFDQSGLASFAADIEGVFDAIDPNCIAAGAFDNTKCKIVVYGY